MSGTLPLVIPVVIESLADGTVRAAPLAARAWMTHGEPREAESELRRFLEDELAEASPATLARLVAYGEPGHHAVRMVAAPLRLGEDRSAEVEHVDFACVLLGPHAAALGRAVSRTAGAARRSAGSTAEPPRPPLPEVVGETWIAVPILDHVFRLDDEVPVTDEAALDRAIADEITRIVTAITDTPLDRIALLPPRETTVMPMSVAPMRPERTGRTGGQKASQHEADRQRRHDKQLLLERMGRRLTPRPAPHSREGVIQRLSALVGSSERLSVLVRGPELVGKSAVVEHVLGSLPGAAYAIPLARFLAGDGGFGDWQSRVQEVFRAAELLDATIYVEDLGGLSLERPGSPIDLGAAISPFLEARRVRFVGEIRDGELDRFEARHRRLSGTLLRLPVEPMGEDETRSVLERALGDDVAAASGRRAVTSEAIAALVPLVARYLPIRALPGEALVTASALVDALPAPRDEAGRHPPVETAELLGAFAARVGIPAPLVRDELPLPPEVIAEALRARVIGQEEAVELVARTLGVVKAGLPPRGKPIATFLFVGPTGTGKTELARSLAAYLFGDESALARFDMSEFMDPWAADRLIRGTDREDGLLTRRARERPFSVLLLDEIEKAHPSVFDLLLSVLGEGRLTDARGKTASFVSTIVVMTSNLGARGDRPMVGFGGTGEESGAAAAQLRRERYLRAVRDHFRPELLNRIDRIVPFRALTEAEAVRIASLIVRSIERRPGLRDQRRSLAIEDGVVAALVEGIVAEGGGARALRRALEDTLVVGLARMLARHPRGEASLGVALAADAAPGGERTEHAGLTITRHASARAPSAHLDREALDGITRLRRRLGRLAMLSPVEAARSEVSRLVSDMARARRRGGETSMVHMQNRHGRLELRLAAVDEGLRTLDELEEHALAAIQRDEPAAALLRRAERVAWDTEAALWQVHVVWMYDDDASDRGGVVLGQSRRALELFLVPLLELGQATLGLTTTVFFPQGIAPDAHAATRKEPWPEKRAWGPDTNAAAALAFLRDTPRRTAARWGAIPPTFAIEVEGPCVDRLVQPLTGRIRFHIGGEDHDLWLAPLEGSTYDDATKLPETSSAGPRPNVTFDLDAGLAWLAGAGDPVPLDEPSPDLDGTARPASRWVASLPRLAMAREALTEGL